MRAEELEYDALVDLLMRSVSGVYLYEASVRLLDRHGYWLRQPSFIQRFVVVENLGGSELAGIDFKATMEALDRNELDGDSEAISILLIAASISIFHPICLRDVVENIDPQNIKHVAEAIMYADGFLNAVAYPQP